MYIITDVEYHRLVLLQMYHTTVLKKIHDEYHHKGLEWTLALACKMFYLSAMHQNLFSYVTNSSHCHVAKDQYECLYLQPGFIVTNKPMNLVFIDFTKIDLSWDGKESVWMLIDAFF